MNLLKYILIISILFVFNSNVLSEEKKTDCSKIKSDNAWDLYKKIKCKTENKEKLFTNPLKKTKSE